jgi:hypothetical protein
MPDANIPGKTFRKQRRRRHRHAQVTNRPLGSMGVIRTVTKNPDFGVVFRFRAVRKLVRNRKSSKFGIPRSRTSGDYFTFTVPETYMIYPASVADDSIAWNGSFQGLRA